MPTHVPGATRACGRHRSLARELSEVSITLPDQGHGVCLNPVWWSVTDQIDTWLSSSRSGSDADSSR